MVDRKQTCDADAIDSDSGVAWGLDRRPAVIATFPGSLIAASDVKNRPDRMRIWTNIAKTKLQINEMQIMQIWSPILKRNFCRKRLVRKTSSLTAGVTHK